MPAGFTDQLHPFVRAKYLELWNQGKKRYETFWRNKWLTSEAKSIDEFIPVTIADHDDKAAERNSWLTKPTKHS